MNLLEMGYFQGDSLLLACGSAGCRSWIRLEAIPISERLPRDAGDLGDPVIPRYATILTRDPIPNI